MATSVFGIAATNRQAEEIIERLRAASFQNDDISVLFPDRLGPHDFAHANSTKAPEGIATGASAGLAIGGVLGWLAGIGAFAIPGIGPIVAAGPIMAALSGAAVGGTIGGMGGALIGLGIPEFEAKRYDGKIKDGNILISVHAESSEEADIAKRVFKEAGASEIACAREATAPIR